MLVRAIALSLALLVGVGTFVPLATQFVEAGPHHKHKKKKRSWRGVKKYSARWWQLYRAQEKRKQELAQRKRQLRLQQLRLAEARAAEEGKPSPIAAAKQEPASKAIKAQPQPQAQAVLPSGDPAPAGWHATQTSPAELQFRVDNNSGSQIGSAAISVLGPANPGAPAGPRSLGGVSTSALRREVIDRMVRDNGWIVNDYQKDVNGQQVYVVVAQSQSKNGGLQSRMFYFTEVDGRIYSVATNAPVNESERIAEESEKVINSLKNRNRPTRAALKE